MQYTTASETDGEGSDAKPICYAINKGVNTICCYCTLVREKVQVFKDPSLSSCPHLFLHSGRSCRWRPARGGRSCARSLSMSLPLRAWSGRCTSWSTARQRRSNKVSCLSQPSLSVSLPSLTQLPKNPLFCSSWRFFIVLLILLPVAEREINSVKC